MDGKEGAGEKLIFSSSNLKIFRMNICSSDGSLMGGKAGAGVYRPKALETTPRFFKWKSML